MKRLWLGLWLLAASAGGAEGDSLQKLPLDLNRDGRAETVVLRQDGLLVLDAQGLPLWESARQAPFLELNRLEAGGDLNGDGQVDLFCSYAGSPDSPRRFAWFAWSGQALALLEAGYLCPLNQRPGTFKMVPKAASPYWVERILAVDRAGRIKVRIFDSVVPERNLESWLRLDEQSEFVISE